MAIKNIRNLLQSPLIFLKWYPIFGQYFVHFKFAFAPHLKLPD